MQHGFRLFGGIAAMGLLAASMTQAQIDPGLISADALVRAPQLVTCTLTTGAKTQCAQFVVKYQPDSLETGPFCPATLNDVGGIWDWDGENPGLYQLDRSFFEMLAAQGYTFTDANGNVHRSDPGAGRPEQDHSCLQAREDTSVEMTILIPTNPERADAPTDLGTVAKVGIGLDGVPIFADAPSVLQTGHLPALDDCGGHVDPGGWYHWHATATDIETVYDKAGIDADCAQPQSASALFGYAFDGYALYGTQDADGTIPADLDACNGHFGPTDQSPAGQYHYHATDDFPNLPPCLAGVQAEGNFVTTAARGIGSAGGGGGPQGRPGGGPGRLPPGFAQAATSLGVTEEALMRAVQGAGGRNLDFDKAAAALGVSTDALRAALPPPPPR